MRDGWDIAVLDGRPAFRALAPDWAALWARDPHATPFQAPEWLIPWAEVFADRTARLVTLRRGGALAALLPLFTHEGKLLPLGAGLADHLDGLFAPGFDPADLTPAIAALPRLAPCWRVLDLPQLRPGSPLNEAPAPAGWAEERGAGEPCPVLPLEPGPGGLPAAVPPSMVRNLRYAAHRAARAGTLRAVTAGRDSLPLLMEALFRLHAARWRRRGEPGILDDPAVAAFHRRAAPALARAGLLRLHGLSLDGRTVAVLYGLAGKGRMHFYLSGFDPDLAPLGLGGLVIRDAMAAAMADGATLFDFLRGREPYKYRWGAVDAPTCLRRLRPHSG